MDLAGRPIPQYPRVLADRYLPRVLADRAAPVHPPAPPGTDSLPAKHPITWGHRDTGVRRQVEIAIHALDGRCSGAAEYVASVDPGRSALTRSLSASPVGPICALSTAASEASNKLNLIDCTIDTFPRHIDVHIQSVELIGVQPHIVSEGP